MSNFPGNVKIPEKLSKVVKVLFQYYSMYVGLVIQLRVAPFDHIWVTPNQGADF